MIISKTTLYSILAGIVAILLLIWRVGQLPARLLITNRSGSDVARIVIITEKDRIDAGSIRNGESRHFSFDATPTLRLTYDMTGELHTWSAPAGLTAGQSIEVDITPDAKIRLRSRGPLSAR